MICDKLGFLNLNAIKQVNYLEKRIDLEDLMKYAMVSNPQIAPNEGKICNCPEKNNIKNIIKTKLGIDIPIDTNNKIALSNSDPYRFTANLASFIEI